MTSVVHRSIKYHQAFWLVSERLVTNSTDRPGLAGSSCSEFELLVIVFSHIINSLLTELVQSVQEDTGLVLFSLVWTSPKGLILTSEKSTRPDPHVRTSRSVNNLYICTVSIGSPKIAVHQECLSSSVNDNRVINIHAAHAFLGCPCSILLQYLWCWMNFPLRMQLLMWF